MFDINQPRPFLRPAVPQAPHEPAAAERSGRRSDRAIVAFIDSRLDGQQALEPDDRNDELVDALLDLRSLLTVPVVPGGAS
jgi:hypothetical protein